MTLNILNILKILKIIHIFRHLPEIFKSPRGIAVRRRSASICPFDPRNAIPNSEIFQSWVHKAIHICPVRGTDVTSLPHRVHVRRLDVTFCLKRGCCPLKRCDILGQNPRFLSAPGCDIWRDNQGSFCNAYTVDQSTATIVTSKF